MANVEKEFPKKYMRKINEIPEFKDAIDAAQSDEIRGRILQSENGLFEIENAVDADEKLVAAKNNVKEFSAPYKESKGIETAKIKYCLHVLESRGEKA